MALKPTPTSHIWARCGEENQAPQPQMLHQKVASLMCTRGGGDKHQAYLCHKADHLQFA